MPDTDKQFELRQLLKAYRKGLISDEMFEEQMREIQVGETGTTSAPPTAPTRTPTTYATKPSPPSGTCSSISSMNSGLAKPSEAPSSPCGRR